MIPVFLHALEEAQSRTGLSRRALCAAGDGGHRGDHALPYSSIQRWSRRQKEGQPVIQKPGPQKRQPIDWRRLLPALQKLEPGPRRTGGTTALHQVHREEISRRDFQILVRAQRAQRLHDMKRIHWHAPGLTWAIDATDYHSTKLVPLHDLASRYRFRPLISDAEDGRQIAAFLDESFRQNGPPLFLKRDNGSPFNNQHVDAVLARHLVLPLNSPPHFPRYNGAMEKGIGDLKRRLDQRLTAPVGDPVLVASVEATVHELNHRPRRCLNGRTACELYHDPRLRLRLSRRVREGVLHLLTAEFLETIHSMTTRNHHALASVWRATVESWLRRQGLISVSHNKPTTPNVSPIFPEKWSH